MVMRWLLCACQLFMSTVLANAQSAKAVVEEFGLMGTWARHCDAVASPANEYAIFSVTSSGMIQLRNDFGPDYDDMRYRILDAQHVGYYRLSMRQLLVTDDNIVLDVVMLKASNRIRIWSSRGSDGHVYVEDGQLPSAQDKETGWMVRCDGQWTYDVEKRSIKISN